MINNSCRGMLSRGTMPLIFGILLFLAFGVALAAAFSLEEDHDRWVKLEVKEAFISRQTSIEFQDAYSPAEFGWHIMINNSRASRANSLYAPLYYPYEEGVTVRLVLVEVDTFFDDIVAGVDLKKDVDKYRFTNNGDWAVIERTMVRPDAKSGPDGRRAGARALTGDVSDSVSFNGGDHTDYYLLPKGAAVIVLAENFNGELSSPNASARILPEKTGMKSVFCVVADSGDGLIRLQSVPGGGTQPYRFLFARGANRVDELLVKAIAHMSSLTRNQGMFVGDDMAKAFMEWAPQAAVRKCASPAVRKNTAKRVVEFCEGVTRSTD